MAYRNKTYIAFDGDTDMYYYNLMKAWKQSDNTNFNFNDAHDLNTARDTSETESIKKQLRERMANSKMFILLLGKNTKRLTRFVKWEVEHAMFLKLPIIVVNLNNKRTVDEDRMPSWLDEYSCISCSFNAKIIQYSLEQWELLFDENENGHYPWKETVYSYLGL